MNRQKLHASELAIAQLTAVYINSQKTKPPYYSPQDFCLFPPQTDKISEEISAIIHSLRRDNLLPNSVAAWLPWESIQKIPSDRLASRNKLRILRTRGAWAIAPEVEGNFLYVPIAVVEMHGKMQLNDPDTRCIYKVEIPKAKNILLLETWWLLTEELWMN